MIIEIDQSGKVEETNRVTVLSFSNGKRYSILIKSKEKQFLEQQFRKQGKRKMFILITFSALIFLLIKQDIQKIDRMIIDQEYFGNEDILKSLIVKLAQRHYSDFDKNAIIFSQIGKTSKAHRLSIQGFRTRKANKIVTAKDIIQVLNLLKNKIES